MKDFLNLPLNASAHGSSIDSMIYSMHYMMLVLFFGWSIYFIFTIIKFRKKIIRMQVMSELKLKFHFI